MSSRRNFLGTLIQREYRTAAQVITPRLPSRYEAVEPTGSLAGFDETASAPGGLGANPLDSRHPISRERPPKHVAINTLAVESIDSPSNDIQGPPAEHMTVEHGGETHSGVSPAQQQETANRSVGRGFKADSGSAEDTVESVQQDTVHTLHEVKSRASAMPPREEIDINGSDSRNRGDEHYLPLPTTSAKPIAAPTESLNPNAQQPGTTAHVPDRASISSPTSDLQLTVKRGQPVRSDDLPFPHNDQEQAAVTESVHTGKTRRAEAATEKTERFSPIPAASRVTATTTVTGAAEQRAVDPTQPVAHSLPHGDLLLSHQIETPEALVSRTPASDHHPFTAPQIGENVMRQERNSPALPVSREEVPVRVTIRKTGDVQPLSSSMLPNASPHREPRTPGPLEPTPTINVTIGRIEVRAVTAPTAPNRNNAGPKPMSLSEYLGQHSGNSNRRGTR
jgi:hypothetical protein